MLEGCKPQQVDRGQVEDTQGPGHVLRTAGLFKHTTNSIYVMLILWVNLSRQQGTQIQGFKQDFWVWL